MTTQAIDPKALSMPTQTSLLPTHYFSQLSSSIKKIFNSIFKVDQENKKSRSLAEGSFTEIAYFSGDLFGVIGKTDAVYNASLYGNPDSEFTSGILLGNGALQTTTGVCQVERGVAGIKQASKNGDTIGLTTSSVRVVRGVNESASGAATAAISGISLANNTTSNAPAALNALGWVAMAGAGFTSAAIMVIAAMGLMESMSISHQLAHAKDSKEAVGVLKDQLTVKDEDRKKILDQMFSEKKTPWYTQVASSFANVVFKLDKTQEKKKLEFQEKLQKILKDPACLNTLAADSLIDSTSLSKEEEAFITKYLKQHESLKNLPKEKVLPLIKVIYQDGLGRVISKKEAVFNRTVGCKTFKLIKELAGSVPSHNAMEAIVKSAKTEISTNQKINLTVTCLSAVGVALTMMTQFATGGVYTLVALGVGLAVTLGYAIIDVYMLYQAFKNAPSTTKDKIMMTLGVLTTFATTILAVVVTNITSHLAPVIALATLSTISLLYVVYKWKKTSTTPQEALGPDQKAQQSHPTSRAQRPARVAKTKASDNLKKHFNAGMHYPLKAQLS